ncbi:polyprenyl synthetase family protein [Candidatus Bathyarchaeota archaeon]|nr:polyprenyl synthetase family protein [Candidatus Bathyarchaeota archaeon]
MSDDFDRMEAVKRMITERGEGATRIAVAEILKSQTSTGLVSKALRYFARVTVPGGLPVFPALVSLSTEAAGGKPEKAEPVAAGIALISWAADVHDDVIDQSEVKYAKKTVYGKFGSTIAILAGDALLILGSTLLNKECEALCEEHRSEILDLIQEATLEIGNAEAKELALIKKPEIKPKDYLEIIRLKAVVPEIICRIGGILAEADRETVEILGQYGRTFGIASNIRDEFLDLVDHSELQNRLSNEVLPLPILYALQDLKLAGKIKPLIKNRTLGKKESNKIVKIVLGSKQAHSLRKELDLKIEKELKHIMSLRNSEAKKELVMLLLATKEGLYEIV